MASNHLLKNGNNRKSCIVVPSSMANTNSGVIRYHGNPPPLSSPHPTCKSTAAWRTRHENLRDLIFKIYQKLIRIQKENTVLNAKYEEFDSIVKNQDYQAALLRYELEQIKKENQALKAKLPGYASQVMVPHITGSTTQTVKSTQITTPFTRSAIHSADLTKEPEIHCVCGGRFKTRQNLREHIKYHSFGTKFRCTQCPIRKHGLNQLRTHMRVTHGISPDYLGTVKGCRFCGQLFTSLSELHEHRRNAHGDIRVYK